MFITLYGAHRRRVQSLEIDARTTVKAVQEKVDRECGCEDDCHKGLRADHDPYTTDHPAGARDDALNE